MQRYLTIDVNLPVAGSKPGTRRPGGVCYLIVLLRKAVWVATLTASLPGQSIVPAKAGLVSYADEAYVDDHLVEISTTRFFVVNENSVLRTGAGRAEVLLGPCAAMWIDDHSSFRMISSAPSDASIEVLTGSVVAATGAMVKGTRLTLQLRTSAASVDPKGAYRLDAEPPRVKVLAGRTTVQWANQAISVSAGRLLLLDTLARAEKFDRRNPEPLEDWSNDRAAHLARLSGQQRIGPDPSMSTGAAPATVRLPNTTAQTPPIFPMPNPASSGCGVTAW